MSGKFVRASKYRHVFGQAAKKELCYENLKITKNAWDSNIINSNGKYISVNWDSSGGGAFAIVPLKEVGKAPDTVPLFRGHKAAVLDTAFDPFDQQTVASCSDDGKICIWKIPEDYSLHKYVDENDNIKDINEPYKVLSGHTRKVGHIDYHPCASNILASCSMDYTVKIWDVESGKDIITLPHKDLVTSFAFNYNGSLIATTSRDKKIRIWDIREQKVISEGASHSGAKPSRVVWLGNTDRIITTGFSKLSDRQVGVWDVNNIDKGPIDGFMVIDSSSGVLIPVFDESNSILYLAGKGDGNIRYYEYENDILHELSQYNSIDPQRGFCVTPKNSVNVKDNEVLRSFKTVNDHMIEPISFIVPRRSELFQADIYPDAPSSEAALSGKEWIEGKTVNGPLLMEMESLYEGKEPQFKDSEPAITVNAVKEEASKKVEEETKIKKEKAAETKAKQEPIKKEASPPSDGALKKVDDALKSSTGVDDLLNKVNDKSDDEGVVEDTKSDDGWEEIKKPETEKEKPRDKDDTETTKEAATEETSKSEEEPLKETKLKEEPLKETKPKEKAKDSKSAANEETNKETKPSVAEAKKDVATPVVDQKLPSEEPQTLAPASLAKSGTPTLKATVEKLASLVDNMEKQINKLEAANAEKDEKLQLLLEKVSNLSK